MEAELMGSEIGHQASVDANDPMPYSKLPNGSGSPTLGAGHAH